MMPGWGSVPPTSIFFCLGCLPPPLSSYDARSEFCTILLHLLLSWAPPSSLVQPAMMPGWSSVPSSSIFSCLDRLLPPLSSYDARLGFCTILLHLLLSWLSPSFLVQLWCQVGVLYHPPPSSSVLAVSFLPCLGRLASSLVQLWCQVGVLYHPPPSSSVLVVSFLPCPTMMPGWVLYHPPPLLLSWLSPSSLVQLWCQVGFCTILLHLLLSWPSPSSLVQLWCQVGVLYHPPPSSPVLTVSFLPCPAMMPGWGSVPSSSIFSCLGCLLPSLSSYDARCGFCTILLHLLLSWLSPSSLVQLWCHVWVLYHPPPSSVLVVSLLPCPTMMPGWGSVPSSSIFVGLGRLLPSLSNYDARLGFCTILLHLLLSWLSPSSLVQLWCQVGVLYHPSPSSSVLVVSLLPCPTMMPGLGSVPSSSIFCLGCLPPPLSNYDARLGFCTILLHLLLPWPSLPSLSNYDARLGFCTILLHLLLSWLSPSSLVQLWYQVRVLYHPSPSSPVLVVSFLPCPTMMPGWGSVPSSSIFFCLGRLLPPLSSYDARSGFCTILLHLLLSWLSPSSLVQLWCQVGFCTILLHLLLSWASPSSLVQVWCQVGVLYHPPPSSPVLVVSFLPCPAMMPGQGSVPSSSIFCLGRLPPPLSNYDARLGFCTILLHLLLSWPSRSSLVQLWCQVGVLYHPPPSSSVFVLSLLQTTLVHIMPDVVYPPHSWSSFCPRTSHTYLHSLFHHIFFLTTQNVPISTSTTPLASLSRGQDYKRFSSMSRCSTHNLCSEMT